MSGCQAHFPHAAATILYAIRHNSTAKFKIVFVNFQNELYEGMPANFKIMFIKSKKQLYEGMRANFKIMVLLISHIF